MRSFGLAILGALLFHMLACDSTNHGTNSGAGGAQSGGMVTHSTSGASGGGAGSKGPSAGTATLPNGGAGGLSTSTSDAVMVWGTEAAADFEKRYSDAFCQFRARCRLSPSVEVCKTDYIGTPEYDLSTIIENIEKGRTLYDPGNAERCFNLFANSPCIFSLITDDPWFAPACLQAFKGTVADGGACITDNECASGVCHVGDGYMYYCSLGKCGPPFPVGAACDQPTDCVSTAGCVGDGHGRAACRTRAALDQSCEGEVACQVGQVCDFGKCQTIAAVRDGQPCTRDGMYCENSLGSFCDTATGTCQPRLTVGSACSVADTRAPTRYPNCVEWADCIDGRCVRRAEVGEACGPTDGGDWLQCRVGFCNNGVCEPALPERCTPRP